MLVHFFPLHIIIRMHIFFEKFAIFLKFLFIVGVSLSQVK
jgi:hypothetical protein